MLATRSARRFVSSAGLVLLMTTGMAVAQAPLKFDFGMGPAAEGYVKVMPNLPYNAEVGFGFETPTEMDGSLLKDNPDQLRNDVAFSTKPFQFSVKVPEGNYRVKVLLGWHGSTSKTTIKAESRRLMVEGLTTKDGEIREVEFLVNVRDSHVPPPPMNAPGNDHVELNNRERNETRTVLHWDDKLTLEFSDEKPMVMSVEIVRDDAVPTIFLAGDSTVTDQTGSTTTSWGQMLPNFFKPDIAVANHAESGETLKSFITELRLDKLLSQMKAGDYLLIQFGHNDSKVNWPQTYVEPYTTYHAYLLAYVAEAKRRGATPIIISSMERRGGPERNSHGDYPAAAKKAAQDAGVAFIDLHAMSQKLHGALGENVGVAFNDATHHSAYGAYELAKCVAEGIRQQAPELAKHLKDDFKGFDPAQPDPFASFPAASTGGGAGPGRGARGGRRGN